MPSMSGESQNSENEMRNFLALEIVLKDNQTEAVIKRHLTQLGGAKAPKDKFDLTNFRQSSLNDILKI